MANYSVEQLLQWTLDDNLIEHYAIEDDGTVLIGRSGTNLKVSREEARELLIRFFREAGDATRRNEA